MRHFISLCVLSLLVAGVAVADRSTYDETKTQIALPLDPPPTIDGFVDLEFEESWIMAGGANSRSAYSSYWAIEFNEEEEDFTRGGDVTTGEGPLFAEDIRIGIYAGYDDENLYIAVRVTDDILMDDSAEPESENGSTWHDDSVEVFVDGDNSNYPERNTEGIPEIVDTGGQYVITINNAYRQAEAGNPGYGPDEAWYARTEITDTGYNAEFRISLSEIGDPQPGDIIGFTVAVNDDDTGGEVDNQYTWVGETHVEASYGNLLIGRRSYVALKTDAPTIDGEINADEYGDAEEIDMNAYTGIYSGSNNDWELGDHDFSGWVVHDEEAIYVAVDVIDDLIVTDSADPGSENGSTWTDDSAEIFFDADNSDDVVAWMNLDPPRPADFHEGQFVMTANGAYRHAEAGDPAYGTDWQAATTTTDDGYQVEFQVLKSILDDPADGSVIGFHIAVNDDDGGATSPKTQIGWCGFAHIENTYGDLTLSPGGVSVTNWSLF